MFQLLLLSSKDNAKQVTLSEDRFNRPVYWKELQTKIETRNFYKNNLTRFLLDASFQRVWRLFVLAFNNTDGGDNKVERNHHRKYFLPRVDLTNYDVLTDGRKFDDQPINDTINKYDEIREVASGQGDDSTAGCLLDFQYFKNHSNLIAIDLCKKKGLDTDSRAIQ